MRRPSWRQAAAMPGSVGSGSGGVDRGECEGCGIALSKQDGDGPDCLECRALGHLSVEELGEPLRTATVRRLDEMLAGLRSRALGDQGMELADLITCLREAVGEAADPFLGAFHDGRSLEPPIAQRAADIGRRVVVVLESVLGESPAARCRLGAELSRIELCARAGTGFVMADRALARAADVATRDPRAAVALLVPAHAGAIALRMCLQHLERLCEAGTGGPDGAAVDGPAAMVRECLECATPFPVSRQRGRPAAQLCPACRLRQAVGDAAGDGRQLRELAEALRARGDGVTAADVDAVWRCLGIDDLFTHGVAAERPEPCLPDGTSLFSRPGRSLSPGHPVAVSAVAERSRRPDGPAPSAVDFLRVAGLNRLWWLAFEDGGAAVRVASSRAVRGDPVATTFLEEMAQVRALELPAGHAFGRPGAVAAPSLMQRLAAVRLLRDRRTGLFTGTGTGKTLAAVLASRVVDAPLTLVLCPNQTVAGWRSSIVRTFPQSVVATKSSTPPARGPRPRYLVVNWEHLQDQERAGALMAALRRDPPALVVLDEIHAARQRDESVLSQRRRRTAQLLRDLDRRARGGLHVLGMTATPVINTLREGRALVELIEGRDRPDLADAPTASNCLALHRALTLCGLSWTPQRPAVTVTSHPPVRAEGALRAFLALPAPGRTVPALERLLVRAKLPQIRTATRRGTLVYSSLVEGVVPVLARALAADGWRVGICTGEDKTGLAGFLRGDLDVLIGSSALSLGLDGLQHVADHLVVAVLPWTSAELHQLTGRLNRPGQLARTVETVAPIGVVEVDGVEWSWCRHRLALLERKEALAGAVLEGRVGDVDEAGAQRLLAAALAELDSLGRCPAA
jgi:ATPase family associated with various cellular activities (AAA)